MTPDDGARADENEPTLSESIPIPLTSDHSAHLTPARRAHAAVLARIPLAALLTVGLLGCDPDVAERAPVDGDDAPAMPAPVVPPTDGTVVEPRPNEGERDAPAVADFSLSLPGAPIALVEGGAAVEVAVTVERGVGHTRAVRLAASEVGSGDEALIWAFAEARLEAGETRTTVSVALPIGARPRLPETRRLRVEARDGTASPAGAELVFETTPTERPDIYVLAGQSNMVGSTRDEARMAGPGEPDAPDPRIRQLDVTINDLQRFPEPAAYTDIARIAVPDERIVEALDPLHDPRNRDRDSKSGDTIGLGLSFAKAALEGTTANIVLVPTAWSDTGFCLRETSRFGGATGWNAVRPDGEAFAGTLLHDRAIARTDLAIAETGGILRGILWHQGEADSDDVSCALAYDENLRDMVASLRTRIAEDARGPDARGPDADIPFVLATMSKGEDVRGGALAPGGTFPEPKSIVDAVHRDVANVVPFSRVVDADDLVPPAYPCGQGFCIHFGARALRELGVRYHDALSGLFEPR